MDIELELLLAQRRRALTKLCYIIEFRMADSESLAISVPAGEARVLKHFQARMPYGLVVPDEP